MNILDAFAAQVASHPDRVAIVDGRGRHTTYAALDARAAALAAAWHRKGLRSGDRVLLALPLDADLYAALAALWRLGAAAILPEPALGLYGVRHAVAAAAPRAVLASGLYRLLPLLVPGLRRVPLRLSLREAGGAVPIADLNVDAPALISFTSGSTGSPKAIVRSHGFLRSQDRAVAPLLDERHGFSTKKLDQTRVEPTDPVAEDFRWQRNYLVRTAEARAGFHQHFIDATGRQLQQQAMQIDLAVFTRDDHAFRAVGVLFLNRHAGSDKRRAGPEEWDCAGRDPAAADRRRHACASPGSRRPRPPLSHPGACRSASCFLLRSSLHVSAALTWPRRSVTSLAVRATRPCCRSRETEPP